MAEPSSLQRYLGVQVLMDKENRAVYRDATDEADRLIKELANSASIGDKVRRAELMSLKKELLAQQAAMYQKVSANMEAAMKLAAAQAAEGENLLRRVLFDELAGPLPEFERAMHAKAQTHVQNYISKTSNGIPLSSEVYKTQALSNGWVTREINRSLLLGEGHQKLAKRVHNLISPDVPGGVPYAANRLARTELNNAFHTTQINQRQGEPWTAGMKWSLSGSHPEGDVCDDYAFSQHFVGGEAGVFKAGDVPGKPHPNCLCYLTTVQISEEEMVKRFLAGDYNTYIDEQVYTHAPNVSPC